MADGSLFLAISGILQVFSISKAVNEDGSEKPLVPHWESGSAVYAEPPPFLTDRSDECI